MGIEPTTPTLQRSVLPQQPPRHLRGSLHFLGNVYSIERWVSKSLQQWLRALVLLVSLLQDVSLFDVATSLEGTPFVLLH